MKILNPNWYLRTLAINSTKFVTEGESWRVGLLKKKSLKIKLKVAWKSVTCMLNVGPKMCEFMAMKKDVSWRKILRVARFKEMLQISHIWKANAIEKPSANVHNAQTICCKEGNERTHNTGICETVSLETRLFLRQEWANHTEACEAFLQIENENREPCMFKLKIKWQTPMNTIKIIWCWFLIATPT